MESLAQQLAQDIPPKYFTAISYEGECGFFFRANLIGLKAYRDNLKKEIGIDLRRQFPFSAVLVAMGRPKRFLIYKQKDSKPDRGKIVLYSWLQTKKYFQ
jgi:hypothetical protein